MKLVLASFRILLAFTVITGIMYPLLATGYAKLFFWSKSGGSLIYEDGNVRGSRLIGQEFKSDGFFHCRLSASDYDAMNSGGTNLGPSNSALSDRVKSSISQEIKSDGLSPDAKIPADLVTASASGLDPHISLDAALIQCDRIAKARKSDRQTIEAIVRAAAEKRYFNIAGDEFVNVLVLNRTLDQRMK